MPDLSEALSLELSCDDTVATLFVQPGVIPSPCDREIVLGLLTEHGVKLDAGSGPAIEQLLKAIETNPDAVHQIVVARGQNPDHGEDARFSWVEKFNPAHQAPKTDPPESTDDPVHHYARSVFRMAEPGDHIATLTKPTPGTDGWTVRGKTLAAKAGKNYPITLDDSLRLNASGSITAASAGAVMFDGQRLKVSTHLEITDGVDFSTGNIHFEGDITIYHGVRDLFVVHATRSIHVHGLVEGAELVAGLDVCLDGGISGREKGNVIADRDINARYIDGARVRAGRHLTADKEIVNSHLHVGGRLQCPHGTLAGGVSTVGGACEVAELGAEGGTPTLLALATIDEFTALTNKLSTLASELDTLRAKNQTDYDHLVSNTSSLTPGQAEQMTELQFALSSLDVLKAKMSKADDRVSQVVGENTEVDLKVHALINTGVTLKLGRYEATFKDPIKGPLRITLSATGRPQITDLITDRSQELSDIARVVETDETQTRAA